ncbi:MAG: hypothetical protein K0U59_04900 [Gammaproteobacteria bacterium]|nr:hypothetical protein [Gammaproteobacteria bacterium]
MESEKQNVLNTLIKSLPAKYIFLLLIIFLAFIGVEILFAINEGADIELYGLKISSSSNNEKVRIIAENESKYETLQNEYSNVLNDKAILYSENIHLNEKISLLEKTINNKSFSMESNRREQAFLRIDNIEEENKKLKVDLAVQMKALSVARQSYNSEKSLCDRKQNMFYGRPCDMAGKYKGAMDALQMKVSQIEKEIQVNDQTVIELVKTTGKM